MPNGKDYCYICGRVATIKDLCDKCYELSHFKRQLLLEIANLANNVNDLNETMQFFVEDKRIEKGEQVFDDHSVE